MFNRLFGTRSPYEKQAPLRRGSPALKAGPANSLAVSEELRSAYKSISYSQYVQDFINESGQYGAVYSDVQLESAYRVSVYLFAALRRVANLTREVRVVAEERQDDKWVRLEETHELNALFTQAGAQLFYEAFLYYAIYGRLLIYKRKTRKGVYEAAKQNYINLQDGGVAGLHIIPNFNWTMIEDATTGEIKEFLINAEDAVVGDKRALDRQEVVFVKDFDPRLPNGAVSMVSLAINDAVSNAAISRWAAHYFMSGAMPLLLVSSEEDPALQTESDIAQYKSLIERAWQGMTGRFAMRAIYTDRKLNVQQAGIDADKVQAPEIDRSALAKISSVVQIAPDLIVPPEGGTQERHVQLIQAAYRDAVLPVMQHFVDAFNHDLGLLESRYRFVIDEEKISALNAERKILADTELAIFNAGLISYGDAQERLRQQPDEDLADWYMINGRLASKLRIMREDVRVSPDEMQYLQQAWDGDAILRSEYRRFLGLRTSDHIPDGFKSQLTQQTVAGTDISGQADLPTAPDLPPSPPPQPGGASADPVKPSPKPAPGNQATHPPAPTEEAGEKAVEVQEARSFAPPPPAGARVTELAPPVPAPPPPDPAVVDGTLAVWLDVGGDPLLQTARQSLMAAMGDQAERVTWADPAAYRVVLAETDDCPSGPVVDLLPGHVTAFDLRMVQTDGIYTERETVIVIVLEESAVLAALRNTAQSALAAAQSDYRTPPAMVEIGTVEGACYIPELVFEARCVPDRVVVGRGDEPVKVIPVLRDWRADLAGHYEPDGSEVSADNPGADDRWQNWLHEIHLRRRAFTTALDEWRADGQIDRLPEPLRGAVTQAADKLPRDLVLRAAYEAVRAGWFDEESGAAENPILMLVRATAKAIKAAPDEDDDGIPDTSDADLEDWLARLDEMDDEGLKSLIDDDDDDEVGA